MSEQPSQDSALLLNHTPLEAPENEFIVRYKADVTDDECNEHQHAIDNIAKQKANFRGVGETWNMGSFKGYHIHIDPEDLDHIRSSSLVDSVENDETVTAYVGSLTITQDPSTWGLGRISHHERGQHRYIYHETAGEGVRIYILDTGIHVTHNEFSAGRARWGKNFVPGSPDTDENGHGTHCAGTAIGTIYGVAKKASAVAVKVLNRQGSGQLSWIISGIQWAYNDAGNTRNRAVISMSLGGPCSQAVNAAVAAATGGGMTVSVAAGNSNADVSNFSPASAPSAVTVAAINENDQRASFSNWGSGVDVFAAGVGVKSAWIGSNSAVKTISGTSMACPHVSGLAAYYIRLLKLQGSAVKSRIIETATKGMVTDPRGSPNRIAYNDSGRADV